MSNKILTILIVLYSWNACQGENLGNGEGWDSGKITLGEISLEGHDYKLPPITLEHTELENSWKGWEGSSVSGWNGLTSSHGGWDTGISIGDGWNGNVEPIVEQIGVPVPQEIQIKIPQLVTQRVPQPYPIIVPVSKPEPFQVVKTVIKTVEKRIPIPVEKIIPVQVDKPVPVTVYKSVSYPVIKRVPIKIPIHKTIHHYSHGRHH